MSHFEAPPQSPANRDPVLDREQLLKEIAALYDEISEKIRVFVGNQSAVAAPDVIAFVRDLGIWWRDYIAQHVGVYGQSYADFFKRKRNLDIPRSQHDHLMERFVARQEEILAQATKFLGKEWWEPKPAVKVLEFLLERNDECRQFAYQFFGLNQDEGASQMDA